jgi:small subunit ribosomal protein S3
MVIGKGGVEIEKYKAELEKMVGMPVSLNVVEVRQPDLNAQLVAENVCSQLEKRVAFRRAMKMAIRNTMRLGAKGIKIMCSGRLAGAEIARSETYHEGTIPLQTIRADIEYGFYEANTTYGKIGVKVWIYRGEVLNEVNRPARNNDRRDNRGDRRNNDRRGDRRNGDRRDNRAPRGDRAPRADRTPRDGGAK